MSDMAAVAAETASVGPTCVAGGVDGFSPAGNSKTTMLSQNAAFNRNFMTLPFVFTAIVVVPYLRGTLAEGREIEVPCSACFLCSFKTTLRKILEKSTGSGRGNENIRGSKPIIHHDG